MFKYHDDNYEVQTLDLQPEELLMTFAPTWNQSASEAPLDAGH